MILPEMKIIPLSYEILSSSFLPDLQLRRFAYFLDVLLCSIAEYRSTESGTELTREIQLTDWSTAGNPSYRSSEVQRPRDICTCPKRYLYSAKCTWMIMGNIGPKSLQYGPSGRPKKVLSHQIKSSENVPTMK